MCEHLHCLAWSPWHRSWARARAVWGGECWLSATVNESCWPLEGDGLVPALRVGAGTAPRKAKGAGVECREERRLFFIQLQLTR